MRLRIIGTIVFMVMSAGAVYAQSKAAQNAPELVPQRFEDWTLRCARQASAAAACELSQSVKISRDGKLMEVISLAVSRAKDKADKINWALVAVTPLDVHLPSKFGISVGKAAVTTAPYRNCNRFGCWAVVPLDAELIERFQAQNGAAALFRTLDGKTVRIVFSLKGFTKSFRALSSGKQPAPTEPKT